MMSWAPRGGPPALPAGHPAESGSEREGIGHANPPPALDHGEEGGVRALMLLAPEVDLRPVEDVVVALDRLQPLDEVLQGQVRARPVEPRHRQVRGDLAVDGPDVRVDLEALLVPVEPGLGG